MSLLLTAIADVCECLSQSMFLNGFREKQFNAVRQSIVDMYGR